MRRVLFFVLFIASFSPAFAVKYYQGSYDVQITLINVSDVFFGTSSINLTFIDNSLPFSVWNFFVRDLDLIPQSMREAMNESPVAIGNRTYYNWSILAGYSNQQPLFRETSGLTAKILLIGKQSCHGNGTETCFASYVPGIEEGSMRFFNTKIAYYEEPYLAMRDIWPELRSMKMLANGSSIDYNITVLLNEIVPEMLIDVMPPYTERLAVEKIPPLIHTSYELIFAQCGVEIENILHIMGELRNKLPKEFRIDYRVIDCDPYEYSDFSLYLEKIPYVIEHPELFNMADYTDSSKIPVLMYRSLDNLSDAYPLFIMKSCETEKCYAGEDILNLIGKFFGLREHNVPNCVMGDGLYFDEICDLKLDMIFDEFRKDVTTKDALLRLNFLNNLDFILGEAEGSPLRYFPGFEAQYIESIADFRSGDYQEVIDETEQLIVSLQDAGFWNAWADIVWDEISSVKGVLSCDICGDGCYGGPGICCLQQYYYDAQCCFNDECGAWSLCQGNQCVLNVEKVMIYFRDTFWWAGPPIIIIFVMLVLRKRIMNVYIRFVFNRMKKKGMREDLIYSEMFRRGYKKENIRRAMKSIEIVELKKEDDNSS